MKLSVLYVHADHSGVTDILSVEVVVGGGGGGGA